jgi:CubicO group peptidase (beta-lactamase class C family)
MKSQFRLLSFAGVFLATSALSAQPLPSAEPEAVGMSSENLRRIEEVLNADIELDRMPGAVVAVARRGKLVYYEAFGFLDKTAGIPMSRDAVFRIASMTKPVTVVGAMTLVEETRLLINDPVGSYLPELQNMSVIRSDFTDTEPVIRQPTLQDLMRHTAGFTYGALGARELSDIYPTGSTATAESKTKSEFIEQLAALPLHYQPGTEWGYSFGLDILGFVIENVSRQSLGQFLDERLFQPLQMIDSGFVLRPDQIDRFAKVLPVDPETGAAQANADFTRPHKFDCGGGCMVSTAADYLRFAQMLLNGGKLDDVRILGRKAVELMAADQLGPEVDIDRLRALANRNGYGFGLGVAVRRGPGVAGTMGSAGDFSWGGANGTYFWVDPREDLAVVFMAATPGATRLHYRQVITSLVYQAIVD